MRLTPDQIQVITHTVAGLTAEGTDVFLFGSRLDDQARGGDVDLFVESDVPLTLLERARLQVDLESALNLPVDLVVQVRNVASTPFQQIARTRAVRLEARS